MPTSFATKCIFPLTHIDSFGQSSSTFASPASIPSSILKNNGMTDALFLARQVGKDACCRALPRSRLSDDVYISFPMFLHKWIWYA